MSVWRRQKNVANERTSRESSCRLRFLNSKGERRRNSLASMAEHKSQASKSIRDTIRELVGIEETAADGPSIEFLKRASGPESTPQRSPEGLSPDIEKKIRRRWSKADPLERSHVDVTDDRRWSVVDSDTGDVVASFARPDDAIFHARAHEYVDALLQEIAQLRRQLHSSGSISRQKRNDSGLRCDY